jgi:hypothetical protein
MTGYLQHPFPVFTGLCVGMYQKTAKQGKLERIRKDSQNVWDKSASQRYNEEY